MTVIYKQQTKSLKTPNFFEKLHCDPILLGLVFLLSFLGIIILFSASSGIHAQVERQLIRLLGGFIVLFFFAQIPLYKYKHKVPYLFCGGVFLLITVLLIGKFSKGAQRWLDLGFFRFQPSELMKIIVPMMLAWYFSQQSLPINSKNVFFAVLIIFFPALLIAKQPDLGTALMVVFSGGGMVFFAGMSYRLITAFILLCSISAPFLWGMLHAYQKLRLLNFFNPERDPLGSGYHIIQSKIAIGSGGVFGKGFLLGTQSHLHFLPEHATDFIFAVLAEEAGFLGCFLLITIFCAIIFRALYIAHMTSDIFSKLLVVSLTLNFFLSAFVNMGMVTGILPVVGIPLPLISYGGSSILVLLASFGIIMSAYSCSKRYS